MSRLDRTYDSIVREFPVPLRRFARRVPFQLGLTRSTDQGWGSFVSIPPNRNLIPYAAEGLALPRTALQRYRIAHQAAGFFGIVADRMMDGQVAIDQRWRDLRGALLGAWVSKLAAATSDLRRARSVTASALADWRRGCALERHALARRSLRRSYGRMIRLKLGWISATARCMLEETQQTGRARVLDRAYHLFLCALQCRDDVLDRQEDAGLRGVDIPSALAAPPGALVRAAALLLDRAARAAQEGGFDRLARWLSSFAARNDVFLAGGVPLQDQLVGMALASAISDDEAQR